MNDNGMTVRPVPLSGVHGYGQPAPRACILIADARAPEAWAACSGSKGQQR